jgi:CAAX protease family protein
MATIAALSRPRWIPRPRWISLSTVFAGYLVVLVAGELAVTFVNPLFVFPVHGGLVAIAGVAFTLAEDNRGLPSAHRATTVAIVLAVAPLIRIISLTLPLAALEPVSRYAAAGIPMALGGFLGVRAAGFGRREIGLVWRKTGWQLGVILASIGLGFVEFLILRPVSHGPFPWTALGALPAISVGFFTGFPEELIFRGLMQTATRQLLGRWNWVYVSGIFAALHIGYRSYVDLLFVFAVGLLYGWVFERTRSIIGVSVGHGVANIVLFFVAPNVIAASALPTIDRSIEASIAFGATGTVALLGVLYWRNRGAKPQMSPIEALPAEPLGDPATVEPHRLVSVLNTSTAPIPTLTGSPAPVLAATAEGTVYHVTVDADPDAIAIDPIRHVIPATRIEVPVSAKATVRRSSSDVVPSRARGVVRFTSHDTRAIIIQPGMAVSTADGIVFRTIGGAILRSASTDDAQSAEIPVEAEVPSVSSHVHAHSLTIVPAQFERYALSVTNDKSVDSGRRVYDHAIESATAALWAELARQLASERPAARASRYAHPGSAKLTNLQFDPPPDGAESKRNGAITLTAKASAKVIVVDVHDVRAALVDFLNQTVPPGFGVEPDSVQGRVTGAVMQGNRLRITVEATAWRVTRNVDQLPSVSRDRR